MLGFIFRFGREIREECVRRMMNILLITVQVSLCEHSNILNITVISIRTIHGHVIFALYKMFHNLLGSRLLPTKLSGRRDRCEMTAFALGIIGQVSIK